MKSLKIEKLIKDGEKNIIGYELNTGSIIDNEQAVYMIKKGELSGVRIVCDEKGKEKIEGRDFNLENLPEVK
ncbi:Protein of unknown function [Caloramator quimbayensis]|uniref:DUF3892 domain-containing protein n=1 Tax=Caloramator quimbayensis TaxID=1147123 RepID=A0A1T4YG06_9CLOT|nr:DUF3892 domain-containing protein [Caloramator quimbayensis]SKB00719.1 Protein of unknown function [Caloramator quimbayensis]